MPAAAADRDDRPRGDRGRWNDPYYDDAEGRWTGVDVLDGGHLAWGALINNSEVADLCDRMPYARVVDPTLGVQVQRSWSNGSMTAFHGPCAPVSGPYLAAVPTSPTSCP